jgi:hypothetical protein
VIISHRRVRTSKLRSPLSAEEPVADVLPRKLKLCAAPSPLRRHHVGGGPPLCEHSPDGPPSHTRSVSAVDRTLASTRRNPILQSMPPAAEVRALLHGYLRGLSQRRLVHDHPNTLSRPMVVVVPAAWGLPWTRTRGRRSCLDPLECLRGRSIMEKRSLIPTGRQDRRRWNGHRLQGRRRESTSARDLEAASPRPRVEDLQVERRGPAVPARSGDAQGDVRVPRRGYLNL